MARAFLSVHEQLQQQTRLPQLTGQTQSQALAWGVLITAGVAAALTTALFDWSLRVPGHAILRCVFPMSLGLALVPRRNGGWVMGGSALLTVLALQIGGRGDLGVGATTSLLATGPMLDLALSRVRRGWQLYAAVMGAGLASNLMAFLARCAAKGMGVESLGRRPFAQWWLEAVVTYVLCGVVAGLVSAGVWFQFGERKKDKTTDGFVA